MLAADKPASQNTAYKDEWLTPPEIIEALGPFDLDPCAPIMRPWDTAARHFTLKDDGLMQPWEGHVWLNPPYGKHTWKWLNRLALHGQGITIIFARTETEGFQRFVWGAADAVLFIKGRVRFYHVDGTRGGTPGAPSVLAAYGAENVRRLARCDIPGSFLMLK